jgi:hypothetical protein
MAAASPARRPTWYAVAGALLVLLVVGGVFIGVKLGGSDDDGQADAATGPGGTASAEKSPEGSESEPQSEPTEADSVEPTTETVPDPTPSDVVQAPYTCWDGTPAQSIDACTLPEGRAGLEYVFPSMANQSCSRLGASPAIGRTDLVQCRAYLDDGTEIKVNYSKWESVSAGRDHYDGKLTRTSADGGAYYTWTGRAGRQYNAAGLFVTEPFSTSVYAPTEEDLALALGLLQGRPPDQVRGGPTT